MDTIFFIAILIMSVVIHEVSHGFVALRFGDKTALYAGRLTLNPLKHLDMFGSVLLPLLLVLSHAPFLFGWAKPVPYNPNNLSNRKWGTIAVAFAGILVNIFVAVLFGLILRFSLGTVVSESFISIISSIVLINLGLAIFNLVPIPPLDGSKILFSLLPGSFYPIISFFEQYSLILIVVFIVFFVDYLYPILIFLYNLITGLATTL
ncbi:site-2 protease family protein [Candidatus Nomurabacteria bacterium CG_4_9_14_0_2_um_filter_32_10]|uniref:Site-2 protease family protein n=2 Tax=Candidatus Nomuraibacteriota TaxID=1752729 RepID=A0A2H0CH98_9BACT|nr:MAG: site-2 protease family protein [Candidatus Nomurabacteria bacterium CG22_combo_CG10-13_8_21_14_all_32_8]PJC49360.1 MAG: site-2 protease family protein [Candidatus Nomurabacteria bacterium CG_4_9_14_0_2_um_filter_32_10]